MSLERRKRRISDKKSKELFDLYVEYLHHVQDKSKAEVFEANKTFNDRWLTTCKTAKKDVVDLNPHGFKIMIENRKMARMMRKDLQLKAPKSWLQNLLSK